MLHSDECYVQRSTVRKDGTQRKEIKIRNGFVSEQDVKRYVAPHLRARALLQKQNEERTFNDLEEKKKNEKNDKVNAVCEERRSNSNSDNSTSFYTDETTALRTETNNERDLEEEGEGEGEVVLANTQQNNNKNINKNKNVSLVNSMSAAQKKNAKRREKKRLEQREQQRPNVSEVVSDEDGEQKEYLKREIEVVRKELAKCERIERKRVEDQSKVRPAEWAILGERDEIIEKLERLQRELANLQFPSTTATTTTLEDAMTKISIK